MVRGANSLRGLEETKRAMMSFVDNREQAFDGALYRKMTNIIDDAKEKAPSVPVDTGKLRDHGHVELPVRRGSRSSVEGGFNTEYAEFVHDNLEAHHDGEGEGPLFLSTHFDRHTGPSLDSDLAADMLAARGL